MLLLSVNQGYGDSIESTYHRFMDDFHYNIYNDNPKW